MLEYAAGYLNFTVMAVIHLTTQPTVQDLTRVHTGDEVLFTGRFFTARDRAHRWLLQHDFKPLHGAVLYHCGPMYQQVGSEMRILAAGPTTSARLNHYTPELLKKYHLRAIVGKGGMDRTVQRALRGKGMYCAAIGGAAVLYAHCITRVARIYKQGFGMTDAIWELEVKDFPVICEIDIHGQSLFQAVEERSKENYKKIV